MGRWVPRHRETCLKRKRTSKKPSTRKHCKSTLSNCANRPSGQPGSWRSSVGKKRRRSSPSGSSWRRSSRLRRRTVQKCRRNRRSPSPPTPPTRHSTKERAKEHRGRKGKRTTREHRHGASSKGPTNRRRRGHVGGRGRPGGHHGRRMVTLPTSCSALQPTRTRVPAQPPPIQ